MCTIVVGAVVMVAEVSVHPRAFGRDVGSYTLVLLLTVGTAAVGSVNIYTALLFIVLYLVYVGAVMIFDNLAREKKKKRGQPLQEHDSAFWHVPSDAVVARTAYRAMSGPLGEGSGEVEMTEGLLGAEA